MSRLVDLIKEKCSNGVEYKNITVIAETFIGLVTTMTKHYTTDGVILLHNSDIKENKIELKNKIFLDRDFAEKNKNRMHKKGDIITVHTGDVGTSAIITDEFEGSLGFATIVSRIKNQNIITPEFLCYFLNSGVSKKQIYHTIKSDRSNLNLKDFNKIMVPIPPIEIQNEIVHILKNFSKQSAELIEELTKELEARQKQYEYYRNKLLSFEKTAETLDTLHTHTHTHGYFNEQKIKWLTIRELLRDNGYIRGPFGSALKKNDMVLSGVPVYEQQHAIYNHRLFRYYVTKEKAELLKRFKVINNDLIISCSGTVGKISIIKESDIKGIINQALLILRLNTKIVLPQYMKYYLESTMGYSQITSNTNKSAQVNISKREDIEKISLPVPGITEQQKIVEILDKFEKLTNDISEGLPAEIEARQKQYECYRNKLLTFKELKTA